MPSIVTPKGEASSVLEISKNFQMEKSGPENWAIGRALEAMDGEDLEHRQMIQERDWLTYWILLGLV